MACGCLAVITGSDSRAKIWRHVFGKLSWPLIRPELQNLGKIPGMGFLGDARCLSPSQLERYLDAMSERFKVPRSEVLDGVKGGVIPIKADGVKLQLCSYHKALAARDPNVIDLRFLL